MRKFFPFFVAIFSSFFSLGEKELAADGLNPITVFVFSPIFSRDQEELRKIFFDEDIVKQNTFFVNACRSIEDLTFHSDHPSRGRKIVFWHTLEENLVGPECRNELGSGFINYHSQ